MDLKGIRITFDPDYPDKVEIGIVEDGVVVEGGQFDLDDFLRYIMAFYNANY